MVNGSIVLKFKSMLIWQIVVLVISFYILIKSGSWLVKSLVGISAFLSVSEYVVSFILMSFATTLPELLVGLSSSLSGIPKLSVGNVFGANIANLGLILGLSALLSGRIRLHHNLAAFDAWSNFILGIFPIILLFDGSLSRLDGIILLSLFVVYILKLLKGQYLFSAGRLKLNGGSLPHHSYQEPRPLRQAKTFFNHLGSFCGSALLLAGSAYLIVGSAKGIAESFSWSTLIVGVFLVALGTTLPELTFAIRASLSRHSELSLGNLIGASVFNSTLILGLVAVISPVSLAVADRLEFYLVAAFMVVVMLTANIMLRTRGRLNRREGLLLLFIYFVFVVLNIIINQ